MCRHSFRFVLPCLAMSSVASADIVYDNIAANNWQSSIFSEDEYAEDTTLSTGAGTIICQVEIGVLRNPALAGPYSGTMTVRLWADAGGTPGAFQGTSSIPLTLTDSLPHIIAANFNSVVALGATSRRRHCRGGRRTFGRCGSTPTPRLIAPSFTTNAGPILTITYVPAPPVARPACRPPLS